MKKLSVKAIINYVLCALFLGVVVVVLLREFIFPADSVFFNLYAEEVAGDLVVKLLKTLFVIALAYLIIQASSLVLFLGQKVKDNTVKTGTLLIGSALKYVAVIAAILLALSSWGVDTTTLVTGAGVLTLVIGLGCQTLVSDVVAGIFMLFEGDIKVGDVVVVNGWRGTVVSIGLRRTKIIDSVGNINIVNNSSISNIINNTRELSIAVCDVGIEYNESLEKVEALLSDNFEEIKKNIPSIVEGPFYKGVAELGDSAVVIRVVAKCKEDDKFQLERDLNRAVKILFDKHGINIPFNQMVISYRDENEEQAVATQGEQQKSQKFVKEQKVLSAHVEAEEQ